MGNNYIKYDSKKPDRSSENIIFATRSHAEMVLDELHNTCDLFGRTSVARFHQLSLVSTSENERKLGWTAEELTKASIVRTRSGYEIIFPDPVPIIPLPEYLDSVDPFPGYKFADSEVSKSTELPDIPSLAPEWRPDNVTVLTDSKVYVVVESYFDEKYCDEPDVQINGVFLSIDKAAKSIIDEIAEDFNDDEIEDWLKEWPTNDANEVAENMGLTSISGHTIFTIEKCDVK